MHLISEMLSREESQGSFSLFEMTASAGSHYNEGQAAERAHCSRPGWPLHDYDSVMPAECMNQAPLSSFGSARPGVPLHDSAIPAERMCGLLESGQLARRGHIEFEAAWPHHITSLDGRMAAILQRCASECLGLKIDSIFRPREAPERNAVCLASSCANQDVHSVFTFHGLGDRCLAAPLLFLVGATPFFHDPRGHYLDLIAMPLSLQDDVEPTRGEVTRFATEDPTEDASEVCRAASGTRRRSLASPCLLCDTTLEFRLQGELGAELRVDFAFDVTDAGSSSEDGDAIGYFIEGLPSLPSDKLDRL
ncbi:hypothetical protein T484DRAFT_1826764 [Baffinella frigidus]|nr:hypothetical protein T484DRAFT_1826764 [Cryptophyta sp. CCMP2293]